MARVVFSKAKFLQNDFFLMSHNSRILQTCMCGVNVLNSRQMHKGGGTRTKAPPKAKGNQDWEAKVRAMKGIKVVQTMTGKELKMYEEFLKRVPVDDVWIQSEYPTQRFSFSQALNMHREYCAPEMFDSTDAFVKFEATLNFKTKKQTKFLRGVKNVLVLPHQFDDGNDPRIVAICKSDDEKNMALRMGVQYAGGLEIIKGIEKGEILQYEFDYLLCTTEMLPDLTKVRKMIKDKFPNQKKGTVGKDLKAMIEHFSFGKSYESEKTEEDSVGKVSVTLGKLDMSDTALRENLHCYLEDLNRQKKCTGNFVTGGSVSVDPDSGEKFMLCEEDLLTESQIETVKQSIEEEDAQEIEDTVTEGNKDMDSDDEGNKIAKTS